MGRLVVLATRPVGVGVVRFAAPGPRVAVIVQASFRDEGGELALAEAPSRALAREAFVPRKGASDLVLVGHAYPPQIASTDRVDAVISVGDVVKSFSVLSPSPADRLPLADGAVTARPLPDAALARPLLLWPTSDDAAFNVAPPSMRAATPFTPGDEVRLVGLSPKGERAFSLPALAPVAWLDLAGGRRAHVELACDTLTIDADVGDVTLVFRGELTVFSDALGDVQRLVVSLEDARSPRDDAAIERGLARAEASFAAELGAEDTGPRDDDERAELEMARLEAWMTDDAPDPETTLDEYAAISAELAEAREARDVTLLRHGFDERGWLLEERGWLERMGRASLDGDTELATAYGAAFAAASAGLAAPEEGARGVDAYAALAVALGHAEHPDKELAAAGLSTPAWIRLDARIRAAAHADPAVARELRAAVAHHEARAAAALRSEDA